jgi:hypothetical protein
VRRAGAASVAVLVLGACGGGGGGTKPPAGGDKGAAERINLEQSDFPSGWTSSAHAASAEEQAVVRQFTECLGLPDAASHTAADVHSPDFAQGQTTTASSEVRFVRTDADASAGLAAFQSSKGPDCFRQTVDRALPGRLPQGATTSNLSARQLEFPTLKDGTAAYQVSLTVSLGGGISLPVYADLIFFRAGRAEVTLNALNTGSPFSADLEKTLAGKMADRT